MATGKRYYWMRLKESFMTSDTIDFFMSQPDGANYVVLYQMLCLKTINTNGRLARQIGDVLIQFDAEKIRRDCKWFSADTIRVALELYKAFGLIYEDVDGTLVLADHQNLIGSETDWAAKKSRQRMNGAQAPMLPPEGGGDNVPTNVPENVPIDIRDIEIRDISPPISPPEGEGKKKNRPGMEPRPEERFTGDLLEAVNEWLDYKWERNRKEFYKPKGYQNLISQLVNKAKVMGDGAVAQQIRYSMANNYQGILFDKLDKGKKAPEIVYPPESKAYRAARYFAEQKERDNPGRAQPTEDDLQRWADSMERLHQENKVDWKTMAEVMDYSLDSEWWSRKVQSAFDFKKHFNSIFADMARDQGAVKE